ncbi:MAG TPA: aminotransferase class I/II-fold pyridoxal phosphate-dependent enzyme [Mycobacteriales bacterium]|nr:aminotransferase class I/II-fold pyridoxal phosphate-dependent enzyme [Mycobacteriales bacterium]
MSAPDGPPAGDGGWPMGPGESTRAVHTPRPPVPAQTPMGLPVYRTAAFAFDSAREYADVIGGRVEGYSYSRIDNPTVDAFAAGMAALEAGPSVGGLVGQAFASGMAAISTTLMAHVSAGDHVLASASVYGGTWSLLRKVLTRFGVASSMVDMSDPVVVREAIRPNTRVVWAETISNPTLRVADLPALAAAAHAAGALLAVDSTFATPAICRPAGYGADLVVHSATKYVGGHSDVTGGVVVGAPDVIAPVRALRVDLGGSLAPDDAFLLHRGLATLPLRVERHCGSALRLARALVGHPAVAGVSYPGLPDHPDHPVALRLFAPDRFGGVVTVHPRGGRDQGMALCDRLRLAVPATSLAGTHTKVSHVASTTHWQLDDDALAAAGIRAGTVRVSVGLEDPEDLIADFAQALDRI